jgi:hypothetical protein
MAEHAEGHLILGISPFFILHDVRVNDKALASPSWLRFKASIRG